MYMYIKQRTYVHGYDGQQCTTVNDDSIDSIDSIASIDLPDCSGLRCQLSPFWPGERTDSIGSIGSDSIDSIDSTPAACDWARLARERH